MSEDKQGAGKILVLASSKKTGDRCSWLCGPHLARCDLPTNEHGGDHVGDCRCERCPTRKAEV